MRRLLPDLVVLAAVATAVLGALLAFHWTSRERALDLYLLSLGALAMVALVAGTREAAPREPRSPFDQALRRRPRPETTLPGLERTSRETALGVARAFDFHVRLRPTLREIAAQRLHSRRGIDLDTQPEASRAVLGDEAYELVRPDRPLPDDRFAPGIDVTALRRVLDTLETI